MTKWSVTQFPIHFDYSPSKASSALSMKSKLLPEVPPVVVNP